MTLARRSNSTIAEAKAQVSRHVSRRLPYYLTGEEAHRLIEATDNERDHLLMRLLWETGVRISEAIAVEFGNVSREGIRVLGKGSVERVVFVQEGLVAAILFYAGEAGLGRDDWLFPSRKGGHITKQRADQIIRRAARRAGLERNVHAHLLRHGYAMSAHSMNLSSSALSHAWASWALLVGAPSRNLSSRVGCGIAGLSTLFDVGADEVEHRCEPPPGHIAKLVGVAPNMPVGARRALGQLPQLGSRQETHCCYLFLAERLYVCR